MKELYTPAEADILTVALPDLVSVSGEQGGKVEGDFDNGGWG